jgi:hypothetical protein
MQKRTAQAEVEIEVGGRAAAGRRRNRAAGAPEADRDGGDAIAARAAGD